MAGVVGDIIQVSLKALVQSTIWRNVWYYRVADPPTPTYLDGLLTEFQTAVLTPYAALLTAGFTFTELSVANLFSGDVAIDVTPTPGAGTRAASGDLSPTFLAAMIVLERQNSRVRNGRKFLPVPMEADTQANSFVAGFQTLGTAVANSFALTLTPGLVDGFTPVIVGRIPYTTSGGKPGYRLPSSQAEMGNRYSDVNAARFINRQTTMNSRKYWRGE